MREAMKNTLFFLAALLLGPLAALQVAAMAGVVEASSAQDQFQARGALDGDRFTAEPGAAWKGKPGESKWWWQVGFEQPQQVGSILQILGDHDTALTNAPRRYVWRWSPDGRIWRSLLETETMRERRTFRIHRLKKPVTCRFLRMDVFDCEGDFPTLREVEVYPQTDFAIAFPDWITAVSAFENRSLPGPAQPFVSLARDCQGWEKLPAQCLWVGDVDEEFLATEPRPMCMFISGSIEECCQRMHAPFRGLEQVLRRGALPTFAACGSAQVLALCSTTGIEGEWDCPRCRDPRQPRSPVYEYIGYVEPAKEPGPCGTYTNNLWEKGPTQVRQLVRDPVFAGLPREFPVAESHCGQIAFIPKGWTHVLTAGEGAKTKIQCMRRNDRYIYAVQFHIESSRWKDATWAHAERIMGNFLAQARQWGGYNPGGKPVPPPDPW